VKKRPQHRSYKMPEAKKPIVSLKNKINYQKAMIFIEKRSWMTKTERTIENQFGPSKKIKESFENAMTCCKNITLSFKTHFAFKKAYKFQ